MAKDELLEEEETSDKKKKKKEQSWFENYIYAVMEKSMKDCLNKALDDIFKDWK